MLSRLRKSLVTFRSDQRGTSIVELAAVAPIFALMVVGLGDLARGFSEKYALQQAVNRTMELAHQGSPDDDYDFLIAEAAAAAGVDPEDDVELETWLECDGQQSTPKKAWTDRCDDGEQIARYITLTIESGFTPTFGSAGYLATNASGKVPITARASLRVQ